MKAGHVLFVSIFSLIILTVYLYQKESGEKSATQGLGKIIISELQPDRIRRDYGECKLTYINRYGNQILMEINTEIRIRGNSSTLFPKKSFGIKLPSKIMLEGMPESKNWILIPNYLDMTFLRNKLSYDLFNSFDTNNKAALTQFVEIYFEDQYYGLYVLTQRIDAKTLGLSDSGLLFKDPPLNFLSSDHVKNFRTYQNYYRNTPQYEAFSAASRLKMERRAYFNQRYPKFEKEDHTSEIYLLTDLLFEASDSLFCDPDKGISHYFELTNIMDWQLLLLFTNNYDGIKKNYYLYKENKNELFKISPWDYDHGYGRDADGEPHPDLLIDFDRLKIFERLVKLNAGNYNQKLKSRYLWLKESGVFNKENILRLMNSYREQIENHVQKNNKRWPLANHKYLKEATFVSEMQLMEDWIDGRFEIIETYLNTITDNLN